MLPSILSNLRRFAALRPALATGLTFAADSLMFGSWVAYIPFVKSKLALDDAQLGLALFGMPLGLLLMNPFSAMLIARFGLARITTLTTILLMLAFALPVWMPDRWTLMVALVLVGMVVAVLNVAMNTCATRLEEAHKAHLMSTCHGLWSMGGMLGSGLAAAMIFLKVDPRLHLGVIATLVAGLALFWIRPLLMQIPGAGRPEPSAEPRKGSVFILPNRDLLLMIFIGMMVSLSEGVAFDWSGVYLRDQLGAPEQTAALGFTFFSLTMMAMRFAGDVLIPEYGERKLLYFTAFLSLSSIVLIILAQWPWLALLGFLGLGAGVAMGAPILFNACARVPGLAPGAGLATYATFSFMGFLAGPPAIGFIGEHFGLRVGFGIVVGLWLLAVPAVRWVRLER